ncbi:hypothetical protein [Halorarius halobius]|uniref:hypothetical protein n=1 Tax=Halorarius halobius TaxID=2962671 RepID=UPI0020CCE815|nr:hypothetical protein [Halorarius halobius]
MATPVVDRLRQPEYTGENRCTPCTAVNIVLAVCLSAAAGYAWSLAVGPWWWVAFWGVFGVSVAAIWLRGYLVPGTPELTKRYFPDWLLAYFDKGPQASGGLAAGASDGDLRTDVDPESLLLSAGVVEPCAQEDDLCLTEAFRAAWHDRMADLRAADADRAALADQLDIDPGSLRFEEHDSGFEAFDGDRRLGQWESRAALIADLAAAAELPQHVDDWDRLAVSAKAQVLGGLRVFLETCPTCEGQVTAGTEVVESCCRSHEVVAVGCRDCDARLLEVPFHDGQAA